MPRFYFFDLDGTLLGPSRVLHPHTRDVLLRLHEQGDKLFLCSGRSPSFLELILPEIPWDGHIGCAGGSIVLDRQSFFENDIRPALRPLLPRMDAAHILYSYETRSATWQSAATRTFHTLHDFIPVTNPAHKARVRKERTMPCWEKMEDFDFEATPVPKISFIAADPAAYETLRPVLEETFHAVYFHRGKLFFSGELIDRRCTKADGIRRVVAHFGGSMADTVCFGDSMNDFQMIEAAGCGVVFQDAPDALKALTPHRFADPDEGGIGQAIEALGLLG